jgi:peptide/nickel transport system permease protein
LLIAEGPEVFSVPDPAAAPRVSLQRQGWRRFRKHTLALISLFILGVLVCGVIFGPLLWRIPMSDIDVTAMLQGPSMAHPFGTNELGQDLLARMIFGGRISLAVGVAAMAVAVGIGVTVGAIAGMASGRVDAVLMWVTDLFLALPQLPLLLLLIYLFREALRTAFGDVGGIFLLIVVVIGGLRWMSLARLVRAQFLSLREKEFVEAARALGASRTRLMLHHLLPNALGPVIVAGTIEVANAIIIASTLSFLGLGFPPDIPTWGGMLYNAQQYLDSAPHWALIPGSAIFLAVLSINFIGDGLRDALDPRRVV